MISLSAPSSPSEVRQGAVPCVMCPRGCLSRLTLPSQVSSASRGQARALCRLPSLLPLAEPQLTLQPPVPLHLRAHPVLLPPDHRAPRAGEKRARLTHCPPSGRGVGGGGRRMVPDRVLSCSQVCMKRGERCCSGPPCPEPAAERGVGGAVFRSHQVARQEWPPGE